MPGSVASGTPFIKMHGQQNIKIRNIMFITSQIQRYIKDYILTDIQQVR